ncbi:flagellar biosynthesis anti-sigma factor FlgM [Variovorax sp. J22P168]|uniref:flagellar biosynthesis anti-sigma factor FlgM n=1 Tax=Variovorax jilinensis TaxID=3053513 RepID=UPI002576EB23|nr:flagellar biosynthesis anti-sigma factor FlgM [Variovorax sp. J22P168]MDM0014747.1 flagellar biosynthesis anti-sigma factor FlgM [Variovorax sp. J22P168]
MKIQALSEAALAATQAATRSGRGGEAAGTPGATSAADAGTPVTVSAAARSLDAASAGSGIDGAKVAAVKAAIANGTFTVDAGAIADKMLSNAQEMLTRVRN